MAETYTDPTTGKVYTGLQAFNMRKKAEKAEKAAAAATPATPAAKPTETAPKAPKGPGRPKLTATTAAPPQPAAEPEPAGPDYYTDIVDAVRNHNPQFQFQSKLETKTQYFERLLSGVLALPESDENGVTPEGTPVYYDTKADSFVGFQPESLAWINSAVDALNNKQPVPDLPGFVDKFDAAGTKKPEKAAKGGKAPKAPSAQGEESQARSREKKVRAKNENGFVRRIKKFLVENDGATKKELETHVATWQPNEKGELPSPATLAVIYSSALEVIELAKAAGRWK
jgi:type IV secretory pathway VirB10-like protein